MTSLIMKCNKNHMCSFVYMRVCVCAHLCVCVCVCVCMCVCSFVCGRTRRKSITIHTCEHKSAHICVLLCSYVTVYIHVQCTYVAMYVCWCLIYYSSTNHSWLYSNLFPSTVHHSNCTGWPLSSFLYQTTGYTIFTIIAWSRKIT